MSHRSDTLVALVATSWLFACSQTEHVPSATRPAALRPGDTLPRVGQEIMVCGQLFHCGTPVVLWTDPYGYDAYRVEPRFPKETEGRNERASEAHYGVRRNLPEAVAESVADHGWELDELRQNVDQFVLHYDVCGTSRRCFKVLQDLRRLSVHFMLDTDGTLYQTLDLKERAWHATIANDRSVGIEIAHIGAYPSADDEALKTWYGPDEQGVRITFPESIQTTGLRTENFVPRPARPEPVSGAIHGKTYYQYDFTNEQYEALAHLIATLHRALPEIRLDYPRDASGSLNRGQLSEEEFASFQGVLGHWHIQRNKVDPGPALDWDRLLTRARELLGE
ncbi:MAG: N-acetylmuramoyl-L-alanine amidase [Planctomycetes bacterium]|nr:N-acetylmuramoyl-L-alanine amidase [Planctomycetota bacterium]MCB9890869.1 N-acetylmuramoyl-L-alanine amidase [Planctomycetota bacterium]